jgi:hypothetical protein
MVLSCYTGRPAGSQRIARMPGLSAAHPRASRPAHGHAKARPCSMRGWIRTEARGLSGGTGYWIGAGASSGALGPGRDGAAHREGRATRSGRAHGALGPGRDGGPFYVPGGPGPPQAGSSGQRYCAVILAGRPVRSASPACPGSAQRMHQHARPAHSHGRCVDRSAQKRGANREGRGFSKRGAVRHPGIGGGAASLRGAEDSSSLHGGYCGPVSCLPPLPPADLPRD